MDWTGFQFEAKCVVPATTGECPSHPLCRLQTIASHQSRAPVYSPSLNDPCTRCLSQPNTSPQCLAHIVSLYALSQCHCLALSRSHTEHESRSLSHQMSHMHSVFLCQRLTSSRFIPHTSYFVSRDRTIQRTDTEPRTARRTQ